MAVEGNKTNSRLLQFLSGQKYENKNKLNNIDFGSATPTQMLAAEVQPKSFKDKRQMYTEKPTIVDQKKAWNDEIEFFRAEEAEMAKVVGEAGGASASAFKSSGK